MLAEAPTGFTHSRVLFLGNSAGGIYDAASDLHPKLEGLDKMSAAEQYLLHYIIIMPTDLGELKLP